MVTSFHVTRLTWLTVAPEYAERRYQDKGYEPFAAKRHAKLGVALRARIYMVALSAASAISALKIQVVNLKMWVIVSP